MIRIVICIMALIFCFHSPAEAGWLGDKLKQAAENVGDKMIDDASDSAYEGAKDAVTPENDEDSDASGRYDSGDAEQYEGQDDDSAEYADEYELEKMGQPSRFEPGYAKKSGKRKKTGPPRTDLHLTADMIMSDPESSPEPIKGKIYLDGAKSRTDFDDSGEYNMGMIVTGVAPTDKVYVLMHSNKMYMVSTYGETDSFLFESGKPCDDFRKAEDLGRTKLNGRSVNKWRCSEPEDPEMYEEAGGVVTLWVDDKLEIPIRLEEAEGKGYMELMNIREGRPSGDFFKLPSGYKELMAGAIPTATSLADQDAKLIKNAGIPLYSKADFVYGNSSVGFRFATSEPEETVRTWYRKQLPSWPVYNEYGGWILYNGKAGSGMGEIMAKPQVSVQKNDKLPEWHSLDKKTTTEILIMVPR